MLVLNVNYFRIYQVHKSKLFSNLSERVLILFMLIVWWMRKETDRIVTCIRL
jgi:hypothetical protein